MIDTLRSALADSNLRAFLAVIRAGEGTADVGGYRRMFGGEMLTDLADHPRRAVTRKLGGRPITSTAAGAYQFLSRTWQECADALALPDFSPASQDLAAAFLIRRRYALDHAISGRLEQAIASCAREWASLPGSPYGQPVKTMAQCRAVYEAAGGLYAPAIKTADPLPPIPPPEAVMPLPAFVALALPAIIDAIPRLGKLFGSGSEVSDRNLKAAELAVEIVKEATGARNAQEAAEVIAADPVAAKAATAAVEARWFELTESGGGGIAAARAAEVKFAESGRSVWQSPSFIVAMLLLPLVYMIVGTVVGLFGAPFSEDVRAAIANGIVGLILGGLIGYYYGQMTSGNRSQTRS